MKNSVGFMIVGAIQLSIGGAMLGIAGGSVYLAYQRVQKFVQKKD